MIRTTSNGSSMRVGAGGAAVAPTTVPGTAHASRRSSIDSTVSWHAGALPANEVWVNMRVNAAMAVAILAGHEEDNPVLAMDGELMCTMLDVLEAACRCVGETLQV